MSSYAYVAVDTGGTGTRGTIDVADQSEALRRIKEMGLFPTKVFLPRQSRARLLTTPRIRKGPAWNLTISVAFLRRVKPAALSVFTRQLATLIEAGMPLLRGLRLLQEQESGRMFKEVIGDLA